MHDAGRADDHDGGSDHHDCSADDHDGGADHDDRSADDHDSCSHNDDREACSDMQRDCRCSGWFGSVELEYRGGCGFIVVEDSGQCDDRD